MFHKKTFFQNSAADVEVMIFLYHLIILLVIKLYDANFDTLSSLAYKCYPVLFYTFKDFLEDILIISTFMKKITEVPLYILFNIYRMEDR